MEFYKLDEEKFSRDTLRENCDVKAKFEKLYKKEKKDLKEEWSKLPEEMEFEHLQGKIVSAYLRGFYYYNTYDTVLSFYTKNILQKMGFDVKQDELNFYVINWSNRPKALEAIWKWHNELGLSENELKAIYEKVRSSLELALKRCSSCSKFSIEVALEHGNIDVIEIQIFKYLNKYNINSSVKVNPAIKTNGLTYIITFYK